tara:strand:- start:403 stop:540 length:138 start_codon:yes stop_codon:yes gene_type:complete
MKVKLLGRRQAVKASGFDPDIVGSIPTGPAILYFYFFFDQFVLSL